MPTITCQRCGHVSEVSFEDLSLDLQCPNCEANSGDSGRIQTEPPRAIPDESSHADGGSISAINHVHSGSHCLNCAKRLYNRLSCPWCMAIFCSERCLRAHQKGCTPPPAPQPLSSVPSRRRVITCLAIFGFAILLAACVGMFRFLGGGAEDKPERADPWPECAAARAWLRQNAADKSLEIVEWKRRGISNGKPYIVIMARGRGSSGGPVILAYTFYLGPDGRVSGHHVSVQE
jgi:hypothetical protein